MAAQAQTAQHPRFEEFHGFVELVEMLRKLYLRPTRRRSRHAPPIIACVQPHLAQDPGLLESIADRLRAADRMRATPYALHQLPADGGGPADTGPRPFTPDDVLAVSSILHAVAKQLAVEPGDYRFPRFELVRWLMELPADGALSAPERVAMLRRALYRRAIGRAGGDGAGDAGAGDAAAGDAAAAGAVASALPPWLRALGVLLTPWFFRLRHSGAIRGFGRRYRWFLHQPNMAPALHRSFFGLADRLTGGQWQTEDPEQVLRLVVNAFLEDLREAFRDSGWSRRYRTTYPIVLLDGITRTNGGYALLRTVSAVRNYTGLFDPLLLITTGTRVPPLALEPQIAPSTPGQDAVNADLARLQWENNLPRQRRRRATVAWLVIVRIPGQAGDADLPVLQARIAMLRRLERPARSWWRTRRVAIVTGTTTVLLLTGGYAWAGLDHSRSTCGDGFTWLGVEPTASDVERIDGACVGVTDGSNPLVLPDGPEFHEVRTKILEFNQRALEVHRHQPDRPLVTLVFMGSLTAPPVAGADALAAEREQLAGMAVAQSVQLDKPHKPYEPLVRILIANAGPGMQHGRLVARRIGAMAATDRSIVAVIGLSESRATTAATIEELATVGLPVISGTLSADSMVDTSRLYFQVAPQNRRQAEVAAAYANELRASGGWTGGPLAPHARVYLSDDPGDIYSQNLAADLEISFTERGVPVETVAFSPSGNGPGAGSADRQVRDPGQAGRDACFYDGIVLYAGRGVSDFQSFLDGVAHRCRERPPFILAGDDVSRYVADRTVSGANRSVPFQFLSFAMSPELGGQVPGEARDFYARLHALFPFEKTERGRSLDGHAAMNYDAAYTAIVAVSFLASDRVAINGGTVWPGLMGITDAAGAQLSYRGVTGRIDFGGTVARRVPVNKPVVVVRFVDGAPNAQEDIICAAPDDPLTKPWCPFDR